MIRQESLETLLRYLNTTDETEDLEAKHISGSEVGRSVYETICALSNEPDLEGGTILLGVAKEEALFPFYNVTGVKNPEKLASDIASTCAAIFNQPIRVSIKTLTYRRASVLRIDVPELPKSHKPVYFKATGLPKGAYRRIGPTDVRCTDDDLAMFYQGGSGDPYDSRIIRDANLSDLDPAAISAYRKARAKQIRLLRNSVGLMMICFTPLALYVA
ncbi:AlbA family DNA-binding domain-containing protein [Methylobacterium nodulans]|uniref:AlbA family DNA-binding domain-containing protein n=1 Tax=Methylobacterium nodulans TaxID=114616 RepID=UPI000161682C|nr:ATP-binding protein [Methylobacterium nodulans]